MTADDARCIHDALTAHEDAERNLHNACLMPKQDTPEVADKVAAAGVRYVASVRAVNEAVTGAGMILDAMAGEPLPPKPRRGRPPKAVASAADTGAQAFPGDGPAPAA